MVWTHRPRDAPDTARPRPTAEVASTIQGGLAYLADIERRLASSFARADPRQRALLSGSERKNNGPLAEVSGEVTRYSFQPLVGPCRLGGRCDAR